MLFNSYVFIFAFLPVVLTGFFLISLRSAHYASLWLVAASVLFYGWWSLAYVPLLLSSVAFNYGAGYLIARASGGGPSKTLLVLAVCVNLALLCVFKYSNFIVSIADSAGAHLRLLNIVLPIGISFFTFTQIAFLVDVYRGRCREYNFMHYILFVTWFPHLIAGPVLHHGQMMPQFAKPATYRLSFDALSVGLTLFAIGLFKKVVLADHFGLYSGSVYYAIDHGAKPMLIDSWVGAVGYSLQIYFDFSGYSDMALGLSRLFNIKMPLNFNSPYKAENVIEFWRRWHMSLSAFLRDYLYVPLGGNRKGAIRRHLNLMITMLLGGLWHGASWNFVVWGGLHGVYLMVNHGWRALTNAGRASGGRAGRGISVFVTFLAVVVAWVPFRAASFQSGMVMLRSMVGLNGISLPHKVAQYLGHGVSGANVSYNGVITLKELQGADLLLPIDLSISIWLLAGLLIVWALPNSQEWLANYAPSLDATVAPARAAWRPRVAVAVLMGVLLSVSILCIRQNSPFLYFQF